MILLQIDLYVSRSVSLSWPQEDPARALRTLTQVFAFDMAFLMWVEKLNMVSKCTPRSFGVLSRVTTWF